MMTSLVIHGLQWKSLEKLGWSGGSSRLLVMVDPAGCYGQPLIDKLHLLINRIDTD